ncbi:MAG: DNA-processing protein DprA [candidate division KSB1 bacterium]|jgi:DNA processing protein|nr:DNA-processing protein DprA [candidate division KSB1 bacterium]
MYIDIPDLINLTEINGLGPTRIRSLIAKFRSASQVFKASKDALCRVEGIDVKIAESIKTYRNFDFGKKQVDRIDAYGGRIFTFWDEGYPSILKSIYDPPVMLYVKGNFSDQDRYALGIVGTRQPTNYGKLVTEKLSKALVNLGITVVSGLARGVDTIAHSVAVNGGGRTLAVIGSGIDVIYPAENKALVDIIIENGAIISEFPLGSSPDAGNFPRRNRIIAGLTLGTVVTEAGKRSGALITTSFALDYNREVFAVPGNVNSSKSIGTNELIKAGAKLVCDVDDIIAEISSKIAPYLNGKPAADRSYGDLSQFEKEILAILEDAPVHIDVISRKLERKTNEILACLLKLEFNDIVKQLPGKQFAKMM